MSIGAYEWEKHVKQNVFVDIDMFCDSQTAGKLDQLEDAIDYAEVSKQVIRLSQSRHFQLIEALAEAIARMLLANEAISKVQVKVTKPGALPEAKAVSVTIVRSL